jgi:hypothetical protein
LQKRIFVGIVAGALLVGGVGVALSLPGSTYAADPTASPAASTNTNGRTAAGNHGGPGGLDADDLTAAAGALGMTEADLTTALNGGKTVATVAEDKGVEIAKVIDAIVASDKAEFAAAVKAGTMTQAHADAMIANLAAHVTNEVNGVADAHGSGDRAPSSTASAGTNG